MFAEYEKFVKDVSTQISVAHDDLMLSWLEPYGITRENYKEYLPRLGVEQLAEGWVQHWFLDGRYIFSIEEVVEWHSDGVNNWSCNVTYRQFQRVREFDPEQED